MNILALIPARGGSKRVPNKNILLLGEKPLLSYTILAAKGAKLVTRVLVSTDSEEIAAVARQFGADVPFLRPPEISQGHSTEMEFLNHVINWLETNEKYVPDLIVLLYPTSPFRKSSTIDRAVDAMLKHPEADSLRSVRKCSEHPYKMWKIENDRLLSFIETGDKNSHTLSYQLLPTVYIQNASIYITKPSTIAEKRNPTGDDIIPFIMDDYESVDINNPVDFELAEALLQKSLVGNMSSNA